MTQHEKMTKTPVGKLILTLGIPTTISMLITNIYNMADTFFVSKISLSASGATGIVFSVMAILQAFGFMIGHGSGSNISRALGAKKNEKASIFSSSAILLAFSIGLIIGILGLIFLEPLMYLLGSTDTILEYAKGYALFILLAGPGFTCGCVLNNILRYEGKATYAMVGLTLGGILNMILDPIFIFGLDMGIYGAGLSTLISQYISMIILFMPFLRGQTSSKLMPRYISKEVGTYTNICFTGSSSLCRQGLNSLTTTILNIMCKPYGDAAIAAMSIVSRIGNLMYSFALGVAQGFQPVASFNYGSKDYKRVIDASIFTLIVSVVLLSGFCVFAYFKADVLIAIFRDDELVLEIGSRALQFFCIGEIFLPITTIASMLFQCVGEAKKALLCAIFQSGGYAIILLLVLPQFIGLTGIELATPIAYFLAALSSLPILIKFLLSLNEKIKYNLD